MENPGPSQRATAPPLIASILKAISDDKALVLFNSIAVAVALMLHFFSGIL